MTRPAFIIHDLEQARAAAAVAEELGQPILLLTPVDMAAALGTLWTQELARHLRRVFPGASILVMFDCGDRAALAHEALRAGAEGVCFTGPADQTEGLAEVAAALGRTFLAHRPAALGLAGISPKRRIAAAKAWISNPKHARNVDSGGFPEKSSKH